MTQSASALPCCRACRHGRKKRVPAGAVSVAACAKAHLPPGWGPSGGVGVKDRSRATRRRALGWTMPLLPTPLPGLALPGAPWAADSSSTRGRLPSATLVAGPCRGVAAPVSSASISCWRHCSPVAGAGASADRLLRQQVPGARPASSVGASVDSSVAPVPEPPPSAAASWAACASAAATRSRGGGKEWPVGLPCRGRSSNKGSQGRQSVGEKGRGHSSCYVQCWAVLLLAAQEGGLPCMRLQRGTWVVQRQQSAALRQHRVAGCRLQLGCSRRFGWCGTCGEQAWWALQPQRVAGPAQRSHCGSSTRRVRAPSSAASSSSDVTGLHACAASRISTAGLPAACGGAADGRRWTPSCASPTACPAMGLAEPFAPCQPASPWWCSGSTSAGTDSPPQCGRHVPAAAAAGLAGAGAQPFQPAGSLQSRRQG